MLTYILNISMSRHITLVGFFFPKIIYVFFFFFFFICNNEIIHVVCLEKWTKAWREEIGNDKGTRKKEGRKRAGSSFGRYV